MIAGPPTGSSAAALLARGVCRALDQLGMPAYPMEAISID
jgi:hypothetical protein